MATKYADLRTEQEKKEYIKAKLKTDKLWQARALIVLYEFQTRDEQRRGNTKWVNNVGFDSKDGKFCSSVAQQVLRKKQQGIALKESISDKQSYRLGERLPKYAGQMLRIIAGSN